MIWLRVDPWLEPLHGDPRFQEIVRRMNLPSFDEVDGGLASGWADVDVLRDPALPPGQQTFFAYAFSRAAMAGPAALKVEGGTTDPR
jgi:hypothetical protein